MPTVGEKESIPTNVLLNKNKGIIKNIYEFVFINNNE